MNGLNIKFGFRDNFLEDIKPFEDLLEFVVTNGVSAEINASKLLHKEVNDLINYAVQKGCTQINVTNVYGQRYIGTRLKNAEKDKRVEINVYGCAGNDLGVFLGGHSINVYGNAQDGVGNTMDCGEIVVHGRAADVTAMSMRGGKVFIRDNVGYRAAIHMKEYKDKIPVMVIGGTAQEFFGEYMAGGRVILLGLNLREGESHRTNYMGTGMHGGVIYVRGSIDEHQLGKEVGVRELDSGDEIFVGQYVEEFCRHFGYSPGEVMSGNFKKLLPVSKRPYGNIYAY